jgi:hypothetical protein
VLVLCVVPIIGGAGWGSGASVPVSAGSWQAPGGVASGLQLWLDGSEAATLYTATRTRWWVDKSPIGRDGREEVGLNVPLLGSSAGYAEATFSAGVLGIAPGIPFEPLTLAIVMRVSSSLGTYPILGMRTRGTGMILSASKVRFYVNDAYTATATVTPATGRLIVLVRTTVGGTDYVSINGGTDLSVNVTSSESLDTVGGVLLSGTLRTFSGGISELAVWNRTLSATERTAVTRALGAKWGITVP